MKLKEYICISATDFKTFLDYKPSFNWRGRRMAQIKQAQKTHGGRELPKFSVE